MDNTILKISSIHPYFDWCDLAQHVVVTSLEIVGHFKIILLSWDLLLDLAVGVVDDGKEHVQEDEEDEEDVGEEEDGPKDAICLKFIIGWLSSLRR